MQAPHETDVSREAIAWCYKLFLGREPASAEMADSHLSRRSLTDLRAFFASHAEFQAFQERVKGKAAGGAAKPEAAAIAADAIAAKAKAGAIAAEAKAAGRLDYIIDRIERANFRRKPFAHLYIENLFSDADFAELIASPEVDVPAVERDAALIEALHARNYDAITFPGTTTDLPAYLAWHANRSAATHSNQETCEGYGVVMRLRKTEPGSLLAAVAALFSSERFWTAAAAKFGLSGEALRRDWGLQKYLDGYEISPHPDIRAKALTFMVNVNPAADSETIAYHTNYLTFRPERQYVSKFWKQTQAADRVWVPWEWCETRSVQTKNNSMVMFSPGDNTLHAIKSSYDHLRTQRTQLYGNLWYKGKTTTWSPGFRELEAMAPG